MIFTFFFKFFLLSEISKGECNVFICNSFERYDYFHFLKVKLLKATACNTAGKLMMILQFDIMI